MDAIDYGYDEITHINWVMMQAMPEEVIKVSNGIMRFEGPGATPKTWISMGSAINTSSALWRGNISITIRRWSHLKASTCRRTAICLRLTRLLSGRCPGDGTGLQDRRVRRTQGSHAADYRASWAKMVALLRRMHGGHTDVAGTDGSGIEIVTRSRPKLNEERDDNKKNSQIYEKQFMQLVKPDSM